MSSPEGPQPTQRLAPTPEGIARAAALLAQGQPVALPTETVYGLAGDALQPAAVHAIFTAKARPAHDPLIVHVPPQVHHVVEALQAQGLLASDLSAASHATATRLATAFWPGPLTLVLPRGAAISDAVTSGKPTVAVRMPRHPVFQAVLTATRRPLVAPSANRFGRISPTCADHVLAELGGRIPAVLDGGPCAVGVESTIVAVTDEGRLQLLRPGGLPLEALQAAEPAHTVLPPPAQTPGAQVAPGLLSAHYAPRTPLVLVPHGGPWPAGHSTLALARVGWHRLPPDDEHVVHRDTLGPNSTSAAQRLYATLRELDALSAHQLQVELPPDASGLHRAILDRLQRASVGSGV